MLTLVKLKQYFGNYREITKYSYLMEDPEIGDIVTDNSSYIEKVVEICPINNYYNYKKTSKVDFDSGNITSVIKSIRQDAFIKEQEWDHKKEIAEYNKILDKGYYIDPNYGFVPIGYDDYAYDDDYDWEPIPASENELNFYVKFIVDKFMDGKYEKYKNIILAHIA